MHKSFLSLRAVLLLIFGFAALAAFAAVPEGLQWLAQQRTAEGSYQSGNPKATTFQATAEALRAQAAHQHPVEQAGQSLAFLAAEPHRSSEYLVRRLFASKALGGTSTVADMDALLAQQNADGGFAEQKGYASNVVDTALALETLALVRPGASTQTAAAVNWLAKQQQTNGAWVENINLPSVGLTATAARALHLHRQSYAVAGNLSKALEWLRSQRGAETAYGNPLDNALALLALAELSADPQESQLVRNALLVAQAADGSWQGDAFLTALALRALAAPANAGAGAGTTGEIAGQVVDSQSRIALEGVALILDPAAVPGVLSAANGSFLIGNVPPGSYQLRLQKSGYPQQGKTVTVRAGVTTQLGTLGMAAAPSTTSTLQGQVRDGDTGTPLAGVQLAVSGAGNNRTTQTAADGGYVMTDLQPGTATMTASVTGYAPITANVSLVAGSSVQFSPSLYANGSTAPDSATLLGQVVSASNGSAVAGATVTVAAASAQTATDGSFTLADIAPGSFSASVAAEGYQGVTLNGTLVAGRNQIGRVALPAIVRSSSATGRITDATSGNPLAGAVVRVTGIDKTATTDADGQYRITGIPAQSFELQAQHAGYSGATAFASGNNGDYGSYQANFTLQKIASDGLLLHSLLADSAAYDPFSQARVTALIKNSGSQAVELVVRGTVYNAQNVVVAEIKHAILPGSDGITRVPAGGMAEAKLDWFVLAAPEGDYRIHLTAQDGNGRVRLEGAVQVHVNGLARLVGTASAYPPVIQGGIGQAVALTADIGNGGNQPILAGPLNLEIRLVNADTAALPQLPPSLKVIKGDAPLRSPNCAAADGSGGLYTVNTGDGKVLQVAASGTTSVIAQMPTGAVVADCSRDSQGQLWILSTAGKIYQLQGGVISQHPASTDLNQGYGISLDASGNFYVTGRSASTSREILVKVTPQGSRTILLDSSSGSIRDIVATDTEIYSLDSGGSVFRVSLSGAIDNNPIATGFVNPVSMTRSASGEFHVAQGNGTVARLGAGNLKTVIASGLGNIVDMAQDPSGNLYVADAIASIIHKITPSGQASIFARALISYPEDITYDTAGNLYINNYSSIVKLTPSGQVTTLTTALTAAAGMAVNPAGDIFVVQRDSGSIRKISKGVASTYATGLVNPQGLTLDEAGNLYVAQTGNHKISRISPSQQVTDVLVSPFGGGTQDSTVAADGSFYVINSTYIAKITGNSPTIAYKLPSGYDNPYGITAAPDGGFYLLYASSLRRMDANGVFSIVASGLPYAGYSMVVAADGAVFVSDINAKKIYKIYPDGTKQDFITLSFTPIRFISDGNGGLLLTQAFGTYRISSSGTITTLFNSGANNIGLGLDGKIYLGGGTTQVKVFNPATGQMSTFLTLPSAPTDLDTGSDGSIYLTYPDKHRTEVYGADGQLKREIQGFMNPKGIAWSGSRVYVGDAYGKLFSFVPGEQARYEGVISGTASYLKWHQNKIYYGANTNADRNIYRWSPGSINAEIYSSIDLGGIKGVALSADGGMAVGHLEVGGVSTYSATKSRTARYVVWSPQALAATATGDIVVRMYEAIVTLNANGDTVGNAMRVAQTGTTSIGLDDQGRIIQVAGGGGISRIDLAALKTETLVSNGDASKISVISGSIYTSYINQISKVVNNKLQVIASSLSAPRGVVVEPDGATILLTNRTSGSVHSLNGGGNTLLASGIPSATRLIKNSSGKLMAVGIARDIYAIEPSSPIATVIPQGNTDNIAAIAPAADNAVYMVTEAGAFPVGAVKRLEFPAPLPPPVLGAVVHSASIAAPALPYGEVLHNNLSFGSWVPPYSGQYEIKINAAQGAVGTLLGSLQVGSVVSGSLTASPSQVAPGSQAVAGTVQVLGANHASIAKADLSRLKLAASSSYYPTAMGADPAGNIYYLYLSKIYKVTPSGALSVLAERTYFFMKGQLPVDANGNVYVAGNSSIYKISSTGVVSVFASVGASITSMVMDSKGWFAVLADTVLYRVSPSGVRDSAPLASFNSPYSIAIDGLDNIYVQAYVYAPGTTYTEGIVKVRPDGTTQVIADNIWFEHEGANITADCADNVFLTPFAWSKIPTQSGEEYTLAQIIGKTGAVAPILDGRQINYDLTDMDFIVYDKYASRLLIWTDYNNGRIYSLPVTCGAMDAKLHLVVPAGQGAGSFTPAPTAVVAMADSVQDFVWDLKGVDAMGRNISFNTQLQNLLLGDVRPLVQEAYLTFHNSFSPNGIKLPLQVPTVEVVAPVDLLLSTDQPQYPQQSPVQLQAVIASATGGSYVGEAKIQIVDANGVLVADVLTQAAQLQADAPVILTPLWNTANFRAGQYLAKASFKQGGILLASSSTPFSIGVGAGGAQASVRTSTDRPSYHTTDTVKLDALVRNQASNASVEGALLRVTITAPDGSVVFSQDFNLGELPPNGSAQRSLSYRLQGADGGQYSVQAQLLNSTGQVLSTHTAAFAVANDSTQALQGSVTASASKRERGEDLSCTDTVRNTGTAAYSTLVFRQLLLNLDNEAEVSSTTQQTALAAGASKSWQRPIATLDLPAGDYACLLQVQTAADSYRTLAHASFKIVQPPMRVSGHVAVAQPSVEVGAAQNCQDSFTNQGRLPLSQLAYRQLLTSADGSRVVKTTEGQLDLPAQGTQTLQRSVDTSGLAPGDYACAIHARLDGVWKPLDGKPFTVTQKPIKLTGQVQASPREVEVGVPVNCIDTLRNEGRRLPSQTIRQVLTYVERNLPMRSDEKNLALAEGEVKSLTRSVNTDGYEAGEYRCQLDAYLQNSWQTLAQSAFKVIGPKIKLSASLELGSAAAKGRVLALLDAVAINGEPSPQTQRQALNALLQAAGWSTVIVDDPVAFEYELRTGDYTTYAVLAEKTKLSDQVQKELRAAVFRGDGLLESGSHDQRNNVLDDVLGVKHIGKHAAAEGVSPQSGSFSAAPYAPLQVPGKALRGQAARATLAGRYLGVNSSDDLALSQRSYGLGRSVYAGYDLLAESVAGSASSPHRRVLLDALDWITPARPSPRQGQLAALTLTLRNEGIATPVEARITLPSGSRVADRSSATVQNGELRWVLPDLPAGAERSLTVMVRLPATSSVNFLATAYSGTSPNLVEQASTSLNRSLAAAPSLADARSLAATDNTFKQVQNWLDKAQTSLNASDIPGTLGHLVKAADEVLKTNHARSADLHYAISIAVLDVSRRY